MELAMHRAYVNLNWDINYSEIARFANFVSPKAQLVMHKVSDFHKSTVTDKKYKLAIKIESVFGTAIWLYHTAT